MTKITAHRGYSKKYPENTLIAFQKAVELGAERVELDVHFTKDKQLVVHHDYLLGNIDNGGGYIFEKNWEYIKTFDVGSWRGKEFVGQRIPLLTEVFGKIGSQIEYEIELKGFGREFIDVVYDTIKNADLLDKVEFTSSSLFTLSAIKQRGPDIKIGMFVPQLRSWMPLHLAQALYISEFQLGNIDIAHCKLEILTKEFVQKLHQLGIKVHAADCNTEEELERALSLDIDQLSTDDLELALQIRRK